jgi:hypothetical protein
VVGGGWIGGGDAQKGGTGVLAYMQGGWCSQVSPTHVQVSGGIEDGCRSLQSTRCG